LLVFKAANVFSHLLDCLKMITGDDNVLAFDIMAKCRVATAASGFVACSCSLTSWNCCKVKTLCVVAAVARSSMFISQPPKTKFSYSAKFSVSFSGKRQAATFGADFFCV
jgi:hypothetical protein